MSDDSLSFDEHPSGQRREAAPGPGSDRPGAGEGPKASRARFVALGIITSRLFGMVRQTVFGTVFGLGPHSDVLNTALRAPNLLQNLLGEQTLSASFIPVYSRFLAEGRREDARRFAGAILGLLLVLVSLLVVAGMVLARPIVALASPGYLRDAGQVATGLAQVDRFELTVAAVHLVFPMTGFLVLSAWALSVLNSHRRFLLSYMAPVAWNVSMISAAVYMALRVGLLKAPGSALPPDLDRVLLAVFTGGLVGGFLQFAVQLPGVLRSMGGFRPSLRLQLPGVREALATFVPALAGRGVVQLSIYVDLILASLLAPGAVGALPFAVLLVNLPFHVFGASVAAAELPELSRIDPEEIGSKVGRRLEQGLRQAIFVIAPSVVGYLSLGFLVVALLFRHGKFDLEDNVLVYLILCGYTFGLPAIAVSRLLQNVFFALRDTRTPARIATARMVLSGTFGAMLMLWLDLFSVRETFDLGGAGNKLFLGATGLSLAAALASWLELALLRRALRRRVPDLGLPWRKLGRLYLRAAGVAVPALALWRLLLPHTSVWLQAILVLPLYAASYLAVSWWRDDEELGFWWQGLRRRRNRS